MSITNTYWLYGIIGEDVKAIDVRDFLKTADRLEPIELRINSPGGVVVEAVAIHTQLTEWRSGVNVQIDGLAASAASYLATLGRHVSIARDGMMMIHEPYGMTVGSADEHRGSADRLDRFAEGIVSAYASRTGRPREEIRKAMKAETWFTAQGAIEYGLADSIVGEKAVAKSRTPNLDLAAARLRLMESETRIAALLRK